MVKKYPLGKSEFEDQEEWEESEEKRKQQIFEDEEEVENQVISKNSLDMIKQMQSRNLNRIKEHGIGYSEDEKKRTSK